MVVKLIYVFDCNEKCSTKEQVFKKTGIKLELEMEIFMHGGLWMH